MKLTVESQVASTLASLDYLEHTCRTILDLEVGCSPSSLLYPLDAPNFTLRDAIDYCRDTLTSQLIHVEQGEAAAHLSHTFSQVAHNLESLTHRSAAQYLQAAVDKLAGLEQTLVRLKLEAKLATVCKWSSQPEECLNLIQAEWADINS